MSLWAKIAVVAVIEAILFFLTRPEELQNRRWTRLAISFFLVAAGTMLGPLVTIVAMAFMAFLWTDVLSHYAAGGIVNFLHRDISSETGIRADFRYARNHRRDGETDKAITAIERELEKEPTNYEGLMLLAEIYEDLNQPGEALKHLQIIMDNSGATEDQKNYAQWEQEKCRQLQRHLDEQAQFKQQQQTSR